MSTDSPRRPRAAVPAGSSRLVRVGLVVFGVGTLATVVSIAIFALDLQHGSAPTWLATTAAVLTPVGLVIAFGGMWREHRRDVRAVREQLAGNRQP